MRTLFRRLNQEDGTTIFISSHILSEVNLIADTIGIIQHGKLETQIPITVIYTFLYCVCNNIPHK